MSRYSSSGAGGGLSSANRTASVTTRSASARALPTAVGQRASRAEQVLQERDRVTLPGLRDLVLGAVGLEEIGRPMTGEAVGQQFYRVGPAGLAHSPHRTPGQPADLDEVHPVGAFVFNRIRREPAGEVRDRG